MSSALAKKTLEVPIPKKKKFEEPTKTAVPQYPKRLKPLVSSSDVTPLNEKMHKIEYEQIPTHKYPFNKEQVVIEDLRNRVYKGTLGVIPVRHSQALEELNFILKGKLIVQQPQSNDNEGSDSEDEEDGFYHNPQNLNTPVASMAFADYDNKEVTITEPDPKYAHFYADHRRELPREKPAILNRTGTLGQVKLNERPKPEKKKRILPKVHVRKEDTTDMALVDKWKFLFANPEINQHQLRQYELEQEMREMLNEAKEIGSETSDPAHYRGYRRMSNRSDDDSAPPANLWSMLNNRRGLTFCVILVKCQSQKSNPVKNRKTQFWGMKDFSKITEPLKPILIFPESSFLWLYIDV